MGQNRARGAIAALASTSASAAAATGLGATQMSQPVSRGHILGLATRLRNQRSLAAHRPVWTTTSLNLSTMGRGRAYRRGAGARGGKRSGGSGSGERHGEYTTFEQRSPKFEAYYRGQGIVPDEEWDTFIESMRTPLPTTFRITSGKPTARQLLDAMNKIYLPFLSNVQFEGEKVTPPRQLEWYPEGLGWHLDVRKNVLRKSPEFKRFQQFLVHETEVGSISRQEAVSMLPPLFLDVRPEHLVLDLCAAPGSKTAQLIEAIHSPLTSSPDAFDPMPLGVVVANDSDTKRAHMLVHQAQRLPSPSLCVTNVDASNMANIQVAWKGEQPSDPICQRELKYDRVLADVPCSGDATLRKNLSIWKDWTPMNGTGLHALQLRILIRGLMLLRPGGRLVYSTCSLNPIENEAVVAAALRHFQGDVTVFDASSMLPALKRRPGMTSWKVAPGRGAHLFSASNKTEKEETADSDAQPPAHTQPEQHNEQDQQEEQDRPETTTPLPRIPWIDSWDALEAVDADLASRTPKSLWPQGDEETLHLERCIRVYPHMQNTGGFFVCVLEKKPKTPEESASMAPGMSRAMDAITKDLLAAEQDESSANGNKDNHNTNNAPGASSVNDHANADETSTRTKRPSEDESEHEAKRVKPDAPKEAAQDGQDSQDSQNASSNPSKVPDVVPVDKHRADREAKRRGNSDAPIGAGGMPYREDPFVYVHPMNPEIQSCVQWFGLHNFPVANLLVRNPERVPLRSVYLTSNTVRAIVAGGGPGAGVHPTLNPLKLRLLNCGVKVFGRQESVSKSTQAPNAMAVNGDAALRRENVSSTLACRWRVVSDSLYSMRPYLHDKIVLKATLSDLAFFIREYYPVLEKIPGSVGEFLRGAEMGSYVLDIQPSEHDGHKLSVALSYPVWRSMASANLMLDKQEKSALSFRLFDTDLSDPDGQRQFSANPQQRKQNKEKFESGDNVKQSDPSGSDYKENVIATADDLAKAQANVANPQSNVNQ